MSDIWQDVRLAARRLRKSPAFTLLAALILAVGIGANTAIFSVVDRVLIRALPYPDAGRIAALAMNEPGGTISYKTFADWRERAHSLEFAATYNWSWDPSIVNSDGRADLLAGKRVSYDFFRVLGVQPLLGRDFRVEDDREGAPEVVILSYGVWRMLYGTDPNLVGRTIRLSERPHTVIGVLPEDFRPMGFVALERPVEVWSTLRYAGSDDGECRTCNHLSGIARLRPGVTITQTANELQEIQRSLNSEYPKEYSKDEAAGVGEFQNILIGQTRPALYSLLGAVAFVLLICCANLANLFLIRGAERRREIATRVALGAGRLRIIRQLLTENLLIAVVGGALGLLLSVWLTPALLLLAPPKLARMANVTTDSRVLLFTLAISVLTGVAFGVFPALRGSRIRIQDALKLGGLGSRGVTADGPRTVLGAVEIALALVLVTGAGLLLRSFSTLLGVDPGFDPHNVATVEVSVQGEKYRDRAARSRFHADPRRSGGGNTRRDRSCVGLESADRRRV